MVNSPCSAGTKSSVTQGEDAKVHPLPPFTKKTAQIVNIYIQNVKLYLLTVKHT